MLAFTIARDEFFNVTVKLFGLTDPDIVITFGVLDVFRARDAFRKLPARLDRYLSIGSAVQDNLTGGSALRRPHSTNGPTAAFRIELRIARRARRYRGSRV